MNRSIVKQAFIKSIPVMAGYIVLGIGFGILLRAAGFGLPELIAAACAGIYSALP